MHIPRDLYIITSCTKQLNGSSRPCSIKGPVLEVVRCVHSVVSPDSNQEWCWIATLLFLRKSMTKKICRLRRNQYCQKINKLSSYHPTVYHNIKNHALSVQKQRARKSDVLPSPMANAIEKWVVQENARICGRHRGLKETWRSYVIVVNNVVTVDIVDNTCPVPD